jgi:hypothetical protein
MQPSFNSNEQMKAEVGPSFGA